MMHLMRITMDYGERGLELELPDDSVTILPDHSPPLNDLKGALRKALRAPIGSKPLRELVGEGATVAIAICDITRAQPRRPVLEAIFDELQGVRPEDVVIIVATGTHRANSPRELEAMVGGEILSSYRIINHDARDEGSLARLDDTSSGVPLWLNREWLDADFRITTGFVEPHFFAGFSGGPKLVAPGVAGLETVMTLHDAPRIAHPKATWGVIEGNPVHDDIREIAHKTGVDFAVDVTLNPRQEVTGVFAGALFDEHLEARETARREAMCPISRRFEVVLTSSSGYPLDQNLYQAVKGMSAAAQIAAPGGSIITVAECREGLPDHGAYADLLQRRDSPAQLLEMIETPGFREADQWQVQIQAQIQTRHSVFLMSDTLPDDVLRRAHLEPVDELEQLVRQRLSLAGEGARLCVLPHGPMCVPYLSP